MIAAKKPPITLAFHLQVVCVCFAAMLLAAHGCSRTETDTSAASQQSRESIHTNFSSELVLDSYSNAEVDGHTFLTLVWHAPYDKPRREYSVFIHAIDKNGDILFQFDHKLVNGAALPTNQWDDDFVKDVFRITPPFGYPPGKYTLRIGVWSPEGERWLAIFATKLVEDQHEFYKHKAVFLPGIDCH
jgi:hypothetical protein